MSAVEMIQGSAAWHQARLGRVTASRVADVIERTKAGKFTAAREKYMVQLLAERLTGQATPHFTSVEMLWGTEQEPAARRAYEFLHDVDVVQVGFVQHPRYSQAGASPDGFVDADGLIEIKAPMSVTHVSTLLRGTAPEDYLPQMQFQMACTGRQFCDFVSYDPRMPDEMRIFVVRVPRDETAIAAIEADVAAFLEELARREAALRDRLAIREAA
ncbi:lambda exonuclease family protein [Methylobacterium iners]|uniref:YqaJ viral recombinase domain-containing protein n=1 Tax=Methylobacterium iners TaxID=418707 RepID=A0ABQ4RQ54_9HYPH|nr:lambda exonuclease family protein [Methylobacterium iners]GJD92881.1 hypothetical protein OCOJLMKI_0064 [Methylobacterium iners]